MKRWFALAVACVLLCFTDLFCVCCAAETKPEEEQLREDFGIYATYIGGGREDYTAPVQDGSSEVGLPDGTVIAVGGIPDEGLTLIIYPVSEADADAYGWFCSCLEGKGSRPVPYEIYFLDGKGSQIPADGVTVSITVPKTMQNPAVFALGTDGTAEALSAQSDGERMTFTADGRRYYAFAEKAEGETSGSTENTESTESTENTENTENTGSTGGTESTENTGSTGSTESTENTESTDGTEGTQNTEDTQNTENTEATEDTENPESTDETDEIEGGGNSLNPGAPASGTGTSALGSGTPGTGDETDLAGWFMSLLLAGAAMVLLLRNRRKSRTEE